MSKHYTQALIIQIAQGVACNRLHSVEQRAARWLLTTRDRVGGPTFPLTQEFLAQMLGVRRASVSEVASTLQGEGLITYTRGIITILDPAGLERRACECYRIIRDVFDRMLANL
ncbi:MAG TPA: helix-turn-helix domain-containing protein [Ktedonobacterales bacterium]|nr:helix-turn-helix domain-containing protein [Ktedonobacterales bacterium]